MSFAEQQWTVNQVNEKIQSSDAGKDLYILGVPRVFTPNTKSMSGQVISGTALTNLIGSVNGSGMITNITATTYAAHNTDMGTRSFVVFKYDGKEYTAGVMVYKPRGTTSLSINKDTPLITSPTNNVYPDNTIFNGYIPFDDGFNFYISCNPQYDGDLSSGSISYMLYDDF